MTELFRHLVESGRRAVAVVDGSWSVAYASPAAADLGACAAGSFLDLVHPDHRGLVERSLPAAVDGETVEFRLSGEGRWAELDATDLRHVPDVGGVVVELRETTARRKVGEGLARSYLVEREAAVRARELEELRAGLLAAVSHDFRTPLTSIVGFGRLLRDQWDRFGDGDRAEMMDRLLRAADQLERRVADFLDISRMDAGPTALDTDVHDVAALVAAAVDRVAMTFDGHRVEVAVDPGLTVLADGEATGRVLENLLGNAAKYAPPASTIVVAARPVDGYLCLSVSDDGPGIAAEDRERVFLPFVRTEGARRAARGAGVGLAAVRHLVEAQGGAVWVDDVPRGARLTVALPMGTVDRSADELLEPMLEAQP